MEELKIILSNISDVINSKLLNSEEVELNEDDLTSISKFLFEMEKFGKLKKETPFKSLLYNYYNLIQRVNKIRQSNKTSLNSSRIDSSFNQGSKRDNKEAHKGGKNRNRNNKEELDTSTKSKDLSMSPLNNSQK